MAVPQSFPAKIYQILENESPEIIQWNENGISFRIVDHGRFEREIVPKYFRHNQISSVQRQLNLYGFKCISRGEFKRSFFHPKFRRGEWETVRKLTRFVPLKKNSQNSDDSGVPLIPDSAEERKSTVPIPSMFGSYYYPVPGASHPNSLNQPDAAFYNRNFVMAHGGVPNGWPDSWERQQQQENVQRMMGMAPHFAYPMMSMHPAMQQHMNGVTMPPHGSGSSSHSLSRLDPARQSELSNRLGFAFGPTGRLLSQDVRHLAGEQSSSSSSAAPLLLSSPVDGKNDSPVQLHKTESVMRHPMLPEERPAAHANSSTSSSSSSSNPEYDLMVEFGMFDHMQLPELMHSAAASSLQVRLPVLAPELSAANSRPPSAISGPISASLSVDGISRMDDTLNEDSANTRVQTSSHTEASAPSSTHSVAPPKEAAPVSVVVSTTSCDMGCNTLLTYSKEHDALVFKQFD